MQRRPAHYSPRPVITATSRTLECDIPTVAGLRWGRGLRASRHNVQQSADETERINLSAPPQHHHLQAQLDHFGAAPAVYRPALPYPAAPCCFRRASGSGRSASRGTDTRSEGKAEHAPADARPGATSSAHPHELNAAIARIGTIPDHRLAHALSDEYDAFRRNVVVVH